jgi:hypothetical protein
MKVRCIEDLITKHHTFKKDEEYEAHKINNNWECVDAVGIKTDKFFRHFAPLERVDSSTPRNW